MAEIKIAERYIGDDHPPVIIAEIGINHEGSLETAIAIADAAIDAGAEIVKHQTHIVADEMSDEAKDVIPGNADVSIYEIMARCALSEEDEHRLMSHVQQRGAIFISTITNFINTWFTSMTSRDTLSARSPIVVSMQAKTMLKRISGRSWPSAIERNTLSVKSKRTRRPKA